ncbi:DUF2141 domain-containing protein [Pelagerythrobacter sp.]|uniref:DUF2141 domain-containing protein n=1 Tax=Pelagerythrobacter sp. TaxID=2800702 RepID=UPI0035B42067
MTLPTTLRLAAGAALAAGLFASAPAYAYQQEISNDLSRCDAGSGPAVKVTVRGVKSSSGTMRVQTYRGTSADWLKSGKWLHRIEMPAKRGTMTFCLPVSAAGTYAVAVRHDVNGNGKTDLREDGGGMSNDPSISIFNLGKPSYTKTRFDVGSSVKAITINMKYWG